MSNMLKMGVAALLSLSIAGDAAAIEWNVSVWGEPRAFTQHIEKMAELVAEKTGSDFTLNISYGGLSKERENLDGISIGTFEMAQFCAGFHADKNPTLTVLELPFLGVSDLKTEIRVSQAIYNHPATQADLGRWNATLLMPSPLPQYNLVGVGDAPRKLTDFEGLTVRATGGVGRAMAKIGAVPTPVLASEAREAIESGTVQAIAFAPHSHLSFGTADTADWWTENLNPGTVNCPVVVNTDALNALSEPHREALLGSVDAALDHYVAFYTDSTTRDWAPTLIERGVERISYTDREIAALRRVAAAPLAAAWIEDMSALGLPAKELYDLVVSTINE